MWRVEGGAKHVVASVRATAEGHEPAEGFELVDAGLKKA